MNGIKQFLAMLCLFLTTLPFSALGQCSPPGAEVHRIYVDSLGSNADAAYLRSKLLLRLERTHTIRIVDDPAAADVVFNGTAAMQLVGYFNSNPRIRYRNSTSVPVYDAKMTVELEDKQGRSLWSGNVKPRFWGSQYVSDNVVNQAARHVADVLREGK